METVSKLINKKKPGKIDFKKKFSFKKRKEESSRIIEKYPDRIPVIVQRGCPNVEEIDRNKFLVPSDLNMANLMFIIRKRIKIRSEESLYLFVNDSFAPTSALISTLYADQKDEDGFLYIRYTKESTFG